MPRSITIRDVPDTAVDELSARAALTGRSLQEYLRARLVQMAGAPDAEAWVAALRARKAVTGGTVSSEQILGHVRADRA